MRSCARRRLVEVAELGGELREGDIERRVQAVLGPRLLARQALSGKPSSRGLMLDASLSRWFGAVALAVALGVAWLLSRFILPDAPRGHNAALDGLRGYLAFGVFLHHATLWHYYAGTSRWELPGGVPYEGFGHLCVSLFFMITSLLFVGKLLDSRGQSVDWLTLYVGRVMRIAPLYYVVVAAVFVVVAVVSGGKLREPVPDLLRHVGSWLGFTLFLLPDVNTVPTGVIVARVTWTLAYEWLFYLTLPLLALCLRLRPPLQFLFPKKIK